MEATFDGLVQFIKNRARLWAEKYVDNEPQDYRGDLVLQSYMFTNVWRELDRFSQTEIECLAGKQLIDQVRLILIGRMTLAWPTADFLMGDPAPGVREVRAFWRRCREDDTRFMGTALSFYPSKGHDRAWELVRFRGAVDNMLSEITTAAQSVSTGKSRPWDLMAELMLLPKVGRFRAYEFYTSLTYSHHLKLTENDVMVIGPGAIGMLHKLVDGDGAPENKLIALTGLVKGALLQDPEFRWIPQAWQAGFVDKHKFTTRTMEDCLCEYRKYVNLSNNHGRRRIYRPEGRA